jgi:electron transport complex protein RnfB
MILPALLSIAGLGLVLGVGLVLAAKYLSVEIDPRVEKVAEELPNANCGACGYAGCTGFADAVVKGLANVTDCTPGGKETAARIAEILGVEAGEMAENVALVLCAGGNETATRKSEYNGILDCRAAEPVGGGDKLCPYGCLGLGTCREVCPFGAVVITDDRLAVIDPEKCTGCGKCVDACPRNIIKMVPTSASMHVLCSSKDKGKVVKGYCTVGCTACKLCSREHKAFDTKTGLSVLDYESGEELPESTAMVCASQSIIDTRLFELRAWVSDSALRKGFAEKQEAFREKRKEEKAAAKAAKDAAKAKKATKADEDAGAGGGK